MRFIFRHYASKNVFAYFANILIRKDSSDWLFMEKLLKVKSKTGPQNSFVCRYFDNPIISLKTKINVGRFRLKVQLCNWLGNEFILHFVYHWTLFVNLKGFYSASLKRPRNEKSNAERGGKWLQAVAGLKLKVGRARSNIEIIFVMSRPQMSKHFSNFLQNFPTFHMFPTFQNFFNFTIVKNWVFPT